MRRPLALLLSSILIGVGLAAAPAEQAHAAWCVTTYSSTTPDVWNLSVADGKWNNIKIKADVYGQQTIIEGTYKVLCPTDYYVPIGKDVKVRCGNGYWVIGAASGWHDHGGVDSMCRRLGGSIAMSYEIRPNGYWG